MLITCPECSHSVSDKAVACPSCGYPINMTLITVKPKEKPLTRSGGGSRRKYRRLPNGHGSIKKLSGRRRKPFAAYPPTKEFTLDGLPVPVPAIGYFEDYYSALDALREYNNNPYNISYNAVTFAELYELYYTAKYRQAKRKLSKSSELSTQAAFKNCSALHDRPFRELRKADMQAVVDGCKLKHASLELIVSLFHGMYKYALENDVVDKDYSAFVQISIPDDDEKGVPFSQEEISALWEHSDDPGAGTILIMIYSGYRISAYRSLKVDLAEGYFQGGVKTKAGKERIVPIHSGIRHLVERAGIPVIPSIQTFRRQFRQVMDSLGMEHTPHDCRHTFSWLCDKYKVDDLSKHLLMGHSIGGDVERAVYGHRTLDELRAEIEKIKIH